jgi:hypothetical protein
MEVKTDSWIFLLLFVHIGLEERVQTVTGVGGMTEIGIESKNIR